MVGFTAAYDVQFSWKRKILGLDTSAVSVCFTSPAHNEGTTAHAPQDRGSRPCCFSNSSSTQRSQLIQNKQQENPDERRTDEVDILNRGVLRP
ncbi:hypothetical protein UPYG_G00029720 [Umbra pygmaea]|uniref:Uncharacterized protein n=1 Tax=Umbra pygmaea TaxID=75934 RepID=A0ABD0XMI2_UMBPY